MASGQANTSSKRCNNHIIWKFHPNPALQMEGNISPTVLNLPYPANFEAAKSNDVRQRIEKIWPLQVKEHPRPQFRQIHTPNGIKTIKVDPDMNDCALTILSLSDCGKYSPIVQKGPMQAILNPVFQEQLEPLDLKKKQNHQHHHRQIVTSEVLAPKQGSTSTPLNLTSNKSRISVTPERTLKGFKACTTQNLAIANPIATNLKDYTKTVPNGNVKPHKCTGDIVKKLIAPKDSIALSNTLAIPKPTFTKPSSLKDLKCGVSLIDRKLSISNKQIDGKSIPIVYQKNMARHFPGSECRTPEQQELRRKNTESARISRAKSKMAEQALLDQKEVVDALLIKQRRSLAAQITYAGKLLKLLGEKEVDWISLWHEHYKSEKDNVDSKLNETTEHDDGASGNRSDSSCDSIRRTRTKSGSSSINSNTTNNSIVIEKETYNN